MPVFKMRVLFPLFFLLTAFSLAQEACAQENPTPVTETWQTGGITVIQDARLGEVLERLIQRNKRKNGMDGYRIQLLFNSGPAAREEAVRTKAAFLSVFPDYPVYVLYQSPFYKVRIGDFRTKREALRVYHEILRKYPTAYIVKDVVKFPDLD